MFLRPAGVSGKGPGADCCAVFFAERLMSGTYAWSQTPFRSGCPLARRGAGPDGALRLPGVDPSPEIPEPTVPSVDPTGTLCCCALSEGASRSASAATLAAIRPQLIRGTVIAPRLYGSRWL